MDMLERFLTFTIDNGVGVVQSADGSSIWFLPLLSVQHNLEEEDEAVEFYDRASDEDGQDNDDNMAYQFDPKFGYPTEVTVQGNNYFNSVMILNLLAQHLEVDFETVLHHLVFREGTPGDGSTGKLGAVVPASDGAVASLEKQAFHGTAEGRDNSECGVTGCAICLEDIKDGEEVTVMLCPRGHGFHPKCITEWLGQSNTCPLCRHALPTNITDDGP